MENTGIIYKQMAAVMGQALPVGKDHKNILQNYMFRSIDDVYNALNKALSLNKVCVLPAYEQKEVITLKTKSGGDNYKVLVQGVFTFIAEDGSSCQAGPFFGEGTDTLDKTYNKAQTAAYKNCLLQVFCIPTEEKKDSDFDEKADFDKQKNSPKTSRKLPEMPVDTEKKYIQDINKITKLSVLEKNWNTICEYSKIFIAIPAGLKDAYKAKKEELTPKKEPDKPIPGEDIAAEAAEQLKIGGE